MYSQIKSVQKNKNGIYGGEIYIVTLCNGGIMRILPDEECRIENYYGGKKTIFGFELMETFRSGKKISILET